MGKAKKIEKCKDGHLQTDVYQEKVNHSNGKRVTYRYRCRRCKHYLDVPANENLLGNPFDIIERRDENKAQVVLDEVFQPISLN